MDLSIIIPVHNVGPYLQDCLEPLTQLKSLSFEVLIIDDGSTDNSLEIARQFEKLLPMKIHQGPPRGIAQARNQGLREAKGEYVYFYDSDDALIPGQFEKLFKETKENGLDIGTGMSLLNSEAGTLIPMFKDDVRKRAGIQPGPEYFMLTNQRKEYSPHVWLRINRREFLEEHGIIFSEDLIHEEEEFSALCFAHATKVAYFPYAFYRYRYRDGSVFKAVRHKMLNLQSIPSYQTMASHLLAAPVATTKGKEALQLAACHCLEEILKRIKVQKQVGMIRRIPSWKELGVDGLFKGLPLKYRIGLYAARLRLLV